MITVHQGGPLNGAEATNNNVDLAVMIRAKISEVLNVVDGDMIYPEIEVSDEEVLQRVIDSLEEKGIIVTRDQVEPLYIEISYNRAVDLVEA